MIKRCLKSIRPLIDKYLIQVCDISDPTVQEIKRLMNKYGKEGDVIALPWVDFEHNKSHLMLRARAALHTDNIFFLDAKEVFVRPDMRPVTATARKELEAEMAQHPDVDIFFLETVRGVTRYNRWQIVRNNQIYYWKYPIHEQLKSSQPSQSHVLRTLVNYARYDGSSGLGEEKYKRYVAMAKNYLKKHGDDREAREHCTFYIAQSYADSSQLDKSTKWYLKYVDLQPSDTYSYVARCRASWQCLHRYQDEAKAEQLLKDAVEKFPHFSLAYMDLGTFYLDRQRYAEVITFSEKFLKLVPLHHVFEDISIRDWRLEDQLAEAYSRSGESAKALEVWSRVLARDKVPYEKVADLKEKMGRTLVSQITTQAPQLVVRTLIPQFLVIDDFLQNAQEICDFALRQQFVNGQTESFPALSIAEQFGLSLGAPFFRRGSLTNTESQEVTEGGILVFLITSEVEATTVTINEHQITSRFNRLVLWRGPGSYQQSVASEDYLALIQH